MADKYSPDVFIAYKHIGYLANSWALLEGTIEEILWFLIETTKGRAVTTYINTPTQIDIIRKLTKKVVSVAAIKEDLNSILERIDDLRLIRNLAVRCRWDDSEGDDTNLVLKGLNYTSRTSPEPTKIRLSIRKIADTNREIGETHTDLTNFYLHLGFIPSFELFDGQD